MKAIIISWVVSLFLVISIGKANAKSFTTEGKLEVFLIHGLLGDETTFRDMKSVLEKTYGNNNIAVSNLTYPTKVYNDYGSEELSPDDFVHVMYAKVVHRFVEKSYNSNHPFSIIAHSQGGLVTMKYLNYCIVRDVCSYKKGLEILRKADVDGIGHLNKNLNAKIKFKTPKNLIHFVSLGTPYWGSVFASKNTRYKSLLDRLSSFIPTKQSEEMANGSASITLSRKFILSQIDKDTGAFKNEDLKDIKFHNIAGFVDISRYTDRDNRKFFENIKYKMTRWLTKNIFVDELETDMVVEVSDARMDFHYYVEKENKITNKVEVKQGTTKIVSLYTPIYSSHVPLNKWKEWGLRGMAAIKGDRVGQFKTFQSLRIPFDDYFSKNKIDINPEDIAPMRTFAVELKLYVDESYARRLVIDNGTIKLESHKDSEHVLDDTTLKDSLLFRMSGENTDNNDKLSKKYQTFFSYGKVHKAYALSKDVILNGKEMPKYKMNVVIDIPGWKKKKVTLNVSPTFTSYAEIKLTPELPLKESEAWRAYKENEQDYFLTAFYEGEKIRVVNMKTSPHWTHTYGKLYNSIDDIEGIDQGKVNSVLNTCYYARVGKVQQKYNWKIHSGFATRNFNAKYGHKNNLSVQLEDEIVKIYARRKVGNLDQYLISSDKILDVFNNDRITFDREGRVKGLFWIDVRDVDLLKNKTCSAIGIEKEAEIILNNIDLEASKTERIESISSYFLGKNYSGGPLGEGSSGLYDKDPLCRFDSFDCTTYVETVLALSLTKDPRNLIENLNSIRYKDGDISMKNRNHFPSLDWITNNNDLLEDITQNIAGEKTLVGTTIIDKKSWYKMMKDDRIQGDHQSLDPSLLKNLQNEGHDFSPKKASINYISVKSMFTKEVSKTTSLIDSDINQKLLDKIPSGSIINIVRPDWNLKKWIGTNLNVSHQGLAIRKNGKLYFRNASSTGQVVDIVFTDYFKKYYNSSSLKGLNVLILK